MKFQQLGNTGVLVSRIALGTMTFGGGGTPQWDLIGALGQKEADELIGQALDAGINLIDTADMYAAGECEEIVGRALHSRRCEVVLATKAYGRMGTGVNDAGLSRLHVTRALEDSLRRLRTDHVDLYQIHSFDPLTPLEETLSALDDAVRQGKVRYIGASNLAAWQLMKALGISERRGLARFESLQSYYSLAGRDIEEEIVPALSSERVGLLVWSPLAGGFLSGKFDRSGASEAGARRAKGTLPPVDVEQAYDIIDVTRPIAERQGVSVAQVALAWVLAQRAVTSVIVGVRRSDQLTDNLGALDVQLSEEDLATLNTASAGRRRYPTWIQADSKIRPGVGS
jgi:aryl-alcohol dehydrogenase-like predicted oxidoreductase